MSTQHNKSLQELETKYKVNEKDKRILLEQKKGKQLKQETIQRQKEARYYILISVLLSLILIIALYAYFKIKKTNKLLNNSIKQKEILLQEVHHRVKNNLTVLTSLLYIQADETDNKETKLILSECQSRIRSMALVHQNLYDVEDASFVNLKLFIEQLIAESHEIFGVKGIKVIQKIDVSNVHFDMTFTVFLGLIINELVTNSFKYAFKIDLNNEIKIQLTHKGEEYTLTYSDSGNGLPREFDIDTSGGFGFKLINIMINQIQGKFNYDKKNNIFTVQFKKT
jgi:two-component sensor histidine kinase